MTINHELVLNYLKKNYGKEVLKSQIVADTGVPMASVTRAVIDWKKKGYLTERIEEYTETLQSGKEKVKTRRYVQLTEDGLVWEPEKEKVVVKEGV